jgi:hypothetical protein
VRICRFLRFRLPTANDHHAAGQDEQERHHEEGEDLSIGHSNELRDAMGEGCTLSTLASLCYAGHGRVGMQDRRLR